MILLLRGGRDDLVEGGHSNLPPLSLIPSSPCVSSISSIRFNILDQDSRNGNDMVACYSTTLASLSPGYRHLPLFNSKGERLPLSSLFIHSRLEEMKEGEEDRIGKEDKEC